MTKILYIVSTLGNTGPTTQLYNIIKYLDRTVFELYLFTLSSETKNSLWNKFEKIGVNLYSLNLSRIQGFFLAQKTVKYLINKIKPDIMHTQGIRGDIISSKAITTIPKITTIHNVPQLDYTMSYGKIAGNIMCIRHGKALKKMSLCIGVSDTVTNNLRKKFNISNCISIYNGIDSDSFLPVSIDDKIILRKKLELPDAGTIFISSGKLSQRKDPVFLIDIWKKYFKNTENTAHLVFIGGGNLFEECLHKSTDCNNIHVFGQINNVAEYLESGDYYISSSNAEGFPLAVLEAMACGLPVLLSDIEPHREIINLAPQAGFLYELKNERSFMESLEKMMHTDRNSMAGAALGIIRNKLNTEIMSNEYQKAYKNIL